MVLVDGEGECQDEAIHLIERVKRRLGMIILISFLRTKWMPMIPNGSSEPMTVSLPRTLIKMIFDKSEESRIDRGVFWMVKDFVHARLKAARMKLNIRCMGLNLKVDGMGGTTLFTWTNLPHVQVGNRRRCC